MVSHILIAAEIIKRRIPGLHQNNTITSISTQDTWEPLEVGKAFHKKLLSFMAKRCMQLQWTV